MLKYIAGRFCINLLLAATVFLPAFLVGARIEVLLFEGWPRGITFLLELSNIFYFYLVFILPVLLASLFYSAASFIVPSRWTPIQRRLAAIVLALILPGTDILLKISGDLVYRHFFVPTAIAVIVYGMFARAGRAGRIDGESQEAL